MVEPSTNPFDLHPLDRDACRHERKGGIPEFRLWKCLDCGEPVAPISVLDQLPPEVKLPKREGRGYA